MLLVTQTKKISTFEVIFFCVYDNCLQNHTSELLLSFLNIKKMLEKNLLSLQEK